MNDGNNIISLEDESVLRTIKGLTFKYCELFHVPVHEREDILQDVYLAFISYKYVERFDASRGVDFVVYLDVPIKNILKKRYRRNKWENEHRVNSEVSSEQGDSTSLFNLLFHVSEFRTETSSLRSDFAGLLALTVQAFPYSSSVVYLEDKYIMDIPRGHAEKFYIEHGFRVFPRSVASILLCLFIGFSQTEIADWLRVSRPWISKKVHVLRAFQPIIDFVGL